MKRRARLDTSALNRRLDSAYEETRKTWSVIYAQLAWTREAFVATVAEGIVRDRRRPLVKA